MSTKGLVVSVLLGCLGGAMAPSGAVAAIPTSSSTATAPTPAAGLRLVPGSTRKVEQLVGDVDRATKRPTVSRTEKRFGIGGTDLGSSFEHEGKLYFLFGDTISRSGGGDALGTTSAKSGEGGVRLDFVTGSNGKWLKIKPPGIDMDALEVPLAGVSVGGEIYLMVKTNHTAGGSTDVSKLVRFDDRTQRFKVLRDVSRLPAGHFVYVSLHHATRSPDRRAPGAGAVRADVGRGDLSEQQPLPRDHSRGDLETGAGTRYFAGLDAAGEPTWADDESRAAPLFEQPEIGDLSVSFVRELGLWLMLYDAWPGRPGRGGGVQLRTSATPWGPWSAPELVLGLVDAKEQSSSTWPTPTTGSSGPSSTPAARAGSRCRARSTPRTSSSASPGSNGSGGRAAEAVLPAVDLEPVRRRADALGVHGSAVSGAEGCLACRTAEVFAPLIPFR